MARAANRRGMTLLELVIASTLLTVLVASAAWVLRGVQNSWTAVNSDNQLLESAHATLRKMVRDLRQAKLITSISPPTDTAGALVALMPSGEIYAYSRNSTNNQILFGNAGTANQLLAENITGLSFKGFAADGVTQTTTITLIRQVECSVSVVLPRESNGARTITCRVWLRNW